MNTQIIDIPNKKSASCVGGLVCIIGASLGINTKFAH